MLISEENKPVALAIPVSHSVENHKKFLNYLMEELILKTFLGLAMPTLYCLSESKV